MSATSRTIITVDFHVEQKVKIPELGRDGVVLAIFVDGGGIQYKVRYFYDGQAREVYFYKWELQDA